MPTSYILGKPRRESANILVPDLAQHKPGCAAAEDGSGLGVSDLESRGIVLSVWRRAKALVGFVVYHEADLCPCFAYAKRWFSYGAVQV